jgi:hypothetical protein
VKLKPATAKQATPREAQAGHLLQCYCPVASRVAPYSCLEWGIYINHQTLQQNSIQQQTNHKNCLITHQNRTTLLVKESWLDPCMDFEHLIKKRLGGKLKA